MPRNILGIIEIRLKSILIQDDPLHLIHHVEEGSSADKAGLKKGDCLACVNGVDVMHFSHDDCIIEIM